MNRNVLKIWHSSIIFHVPNNWSKCCQRKVDPRIRNQVCLKNFIFKFVQIQKICQFLKKNVTWNSWRSTFNAPSNRREAVTKIIVKFSYSKCTNFKKIHSEARENTWWNNLSDKAVEIFIRRSFDPKFFST